MPPSSKPCRAGESIEDFCRVCKTDRMHTVVAADAAGRPIRVDCGYCHSEHNYRGGPRVVDAGRGTGAAPPSRSRSPIAYAPASSARIEREPFPLVSDRERTGPAMSVNGTDDLELLLRRIIREETGISPVVPAEK